MGIKDPTGNLARWALPLQQHDFAIIHHPGMSNGNADELSCLPRRNIQLAAIDSPGVQTYTVHDLQRGDACLRTLIANLESNELPHDNRIARTLLLHADDFFLNDDGIFCHLWHPGQRRASHLLSQLFVPSNLRHEILTNAITMVPADISEFTRPMRNCGVNTINLECSKMSSIGASLAPTVQ